MAHSEYELKKALDKCIAAVFTCKQDFLSALLCNLELKFDDSIPTACTNGVYLKWNPDFFMGLPVDTRRNIMFHELWHVGRLHGIRRGSRDPKIWNYACDYRINNDMVAEGMDFKGVSALIDPIYTSDMPEEEIYNHLISNGIKVPSWELDGDMDEMPSGDTITAEEQMKQIQAVSRAIQQAKLSGSAGSIPGGIEKWVNSFLAPVIPWQQVLQQWFMDRVKDDYSWARPNRRYQDVYLPSMNDTESKLAKLNYYVDVSGSITQEQIIRFNSELKHIKEQYNPEELRVVLFDTRITEEYIFYEGDSFDKIRVIGGGGTSLKPVREHMLNTQPTAAIVFSDMCCAPMEPLTKNIPVIWIVVGNPDIKVPFGTAIHIKE